MRSIRRLLLTLFLLAPATTVATEIVVVSDLNGRYGSVEYNRRIPLAVQDIINRDVDLVLSAGDMVAGQHRDLDEEDLRAMWRAFHETVSDPLAAAGIPFAITPGNHDGSGLKGFEHEREEFIRQWGSRAGSLTLLPGSDWPERYALQYEDVLIISIDGTRPGPLPTGELDYLERMLETHGGAARYRLVLSHLPIWPLARGRERDIINDAELLSLLRRQRVDVFISGHHHVYFSGQDEAGVLHLSAGALGGSTRAFTDGTPRQPFSYTVLRFDPDTIYVEAVAAPGFDSVLPPSALPAELSGPLGTLRSVDRLERRSP